jgi:histidinol-phosphate phosphatase family protein
MTSAIFLDRDGTINELAPPHEYITTREQFRFLPGALDALAFLAQNSGRKIVIVTNQACLGKGLATWEQVLSLHEWMEGQIEEAGGRLDGIYVCPHRPDENLRLCLPQASHSTSPSPSL